MAKAVRRYYATKKRLARMSPEARYWVLRWQVESWRARVRRAYVATKGEPWRR